MQSNLTNDTYKDYIKILLKWNKVFNLSSVEESDMYNYHVRDSLSVSQFLNGQNILDVGSGTGAPGIPLAIYNNQLNFFLIESSYKKAMFLEEVKRVLNLSNVRIIHSRVEKFSLDVDKEKTKMIDTQPNIREYAAFQTIICRAFGKTVDLIEKSKHLSDKNGIFINMKGKYPTEDIDILNKLNIPNKIVKIENADLERHLVIVENKFL